MKLLASLLTLMAMAGFATAQSTAPVPEIDGSSIASGLALVSGALLVLRGRRK